MKIFIDFDDVIFNTKQFRHDLRSMFFENGVSGDVYDRCYHDPNDSGIIKIFDPKKQIERIDAEIGVDKEKFNNLVEKFMLNISQYVFEDVENFVLSLGGENICIISFGEKKFQAEKIENSKIESLIRCVIMTGSLKSEEIANAFERGEIDQEERIFFLDDRIEQIRDVKEKFPNIITIFVKRPEGRYQEMCMEDCCNLEVHNLKEAQKIIENYEQKN